MPITNRIQFVPMAEFDTANLLDPDVWYLVMGPTTKPLCGLFLRNFSTADIIVSYDGRRPHDFLRPNSEVDYKFQANSLFVNGVANIAKNTGIYIKGAAGVGFFYCSALTVYS